MQLRTRSLRYLIVMLATAGLTGCLIVPTPELSEIRHSRLEFIEPGVTTQWDVDRQLLSRDVFKGYESDRYTVYAEYRRAPFSIVAENTTDFLGDVDDYLVVEYDINDTVVRFDRVMREGGCTDYGLCVRGGAANNTDSIIVYGPSSDDEALKSFDSEGKTCSVYAYVDGGRPCNGASFEVIATHPGSHSMHTMRARVDGYFHWFIPARENAPSFGTLVARRRGEVLDNFRFDCDAGEIQIVALELASCTIGKPRARFVPIAFADGEDEILERRLVWQ